MGEQVIEVLKKAERNKKRSIRLPNESWQRDTILEQVDESESKPDSESAEEEDWFENWLD
jgi:hypothetical protein